jgi:CRISPR-associated protein Cmr3
VSVWLIEPLDPLIARDGKPAAVGHFRTVSFPYPSMIAGAVRTRIGCENGAFTIPRASLPELLKKVLVRGPVLTELDAEGKVLQWLAPAPRDAAILRDPDVPEERPIVRRLSPRPLSAEEGMDSLREHSLRPVAFAGAETYGKPPKKVPAFWNWKDFEAWLTAPADRPGIDLGALGIESLPVETRAHLALQPGERVGIDGMLFQTSGLRFLQGQEQDGRPSLAPRRFALSLWAQGATVAGRPLALRQQIAPLGGERRLARWSPASAEWPRMPEAVREKIVSTRRARLILLTPAIFEGGALPGWNGGPWPLDGSVKATVRAACVSRPEVVSGWDLAADNGTDKPKGRPKRTRRLAPGGSVYFIELDGTPDDLRRWCDQTWLACVSDVEQDRRDGFGLAVLGTWEETR